MRPPVSSVGRSPACWTSDSVELSSLGKLLMSARGLMDAACISAWC